MVYSPHSPTPFNAIMIFGVVFSLNSNLMRKHENIFSNATADRKLEVDHLEQLVGISVASKNEKLYM